MTLWKKDVCFKRTAVSRLLELKEAARLRASLEPWNDTLRRVTDKGEIHVHHILTVHVPSTGRYNNIATLSESLSPTNSEGYMIVESFCD